MLSITHRNRALWDVPSEPADQEWVYQLGLPFQISPTEVGILANIRLGSILTVDLEIGNDLVIVDDLNAIDTRRVLPLDRAETGPHPRTGKPTLFARYPLVGGFVPLGAKRADGSPHPHAGTGFAMAQVIGFPGDRVIYWIGELPKEDGYRAIELQQYRYDGTSFEVVDSKVIETSELFPGSEFSHAGLGNAIPDGDDLLLAAVQMEKKSKVESHVDPKGLAGVMRWRCTDKGWGMVEFLPVPGTEGCIEPSVIRDHDNSLLFTARNHTKSIRVWRSADNGQTWQQVLDGPDRIAHTPLSLNRISDDVVYFSTNPNIGEIDSTGTERGSIEMREILNLWPLTKDRRGLEDPVVVRDCLKEFGPAPDNTIWRADHPVGLNVRLADERWHHILCYRTMTREECNGEAPVTERTGMHIEEITGAGPIAELWRF